MYNEQYIVYNEIAELMGISALQGQIQLRNHTQYLLMSKSRMNEVVGTHAENQ